MGHTVQQRPKLLARIRRLKGQMEAIERALETDAPCGDVLNLVASVRGAVNGLTSELIEDHIREHVMQAENKTAALKGATELIEVVKMYLK